jgi:hypothetical protein
MKLKMIKCASCGVDMPELRLTKFGYKVCVDCSTIGAYKAISTINGTGDHTWNDIQIMTPEQAKLADEANSKKVKFDSYKDLDA